MKDIERAKQLQRKLLEAVGRKWTEDDFNDFWYARPFGSDWDYWYENNIYRPVDFCASCGDDSLSDDKTQRAWWSNRHSTLGVRIFLCNDCYKTRFGEIDMNKGFSSSNQSNTIFGLQLLKHSCFLSIPVFIWYVFLPSGLSNLLSILLAALPLWFISWIGSIQSIPSVRSLRTPLAMGFFMPMFLLPFVKLLPWLIYPSIVLIFFALVLSFNQSIHCGIVTLFSTIILYFIYGFYWRKIQIKRGFLGVW